MVYHPIQWTPNTTAGEQILVSGGHLSNLYAIPAVPNSSPKVPYLLASAPGESTEQSALIPDGVTNIHLIDSVHSPDFGEMVIIVYNLNMLRVSVGDNNYDMQLTTEASEYLNAGQITKAASDGRNILVLLNNRRVAAVRLSTTAGVTSLSVSYPAFPVFDNPTGADIGWADILWIDNYFFLVSRNGQFFHSGLGSTDFNQLDYANSNAIVDGIVGAEALSLRLYILGNRSIEVWSNTGGLDFAYRRQNSIVIEIGCLDRDTIVNHDIGILFVGSDRIIYSLNTSSSIAPVSTDAINELMVNASNFSSYGYIEHGHRFYVLSFDIPAGRQCWCYDLNTRLWHERTGTAVNHIASAHWGGKNWVATAAELRSLGRQYANASDKVAITSVVHSDRSRITCHSFEVEAENNDLDADVAGSTISLQWNDSKGQGAYVDNRESRDASMQRIRWHRLGQFRNRNFRIRITGSDPVVVLGAYGELSVQEG